MHIPETLFISGLYKRKLRMEIKAIIFDFDGVVVDTEPLYENAENRLFREYGVVVSEEDWRKFKGLSEEAFYRYIRDKFKIRAPLQELKEKGREYLKEEFKKNIRYVDGFLDFFRAIRDSYITALVTSSSEEILTWIFNNTKIENCFDFIVTSQDVNNSKPHPEPYLKACQLMGIKPSEAVAIEDSINGIKSSTEAGILTIGLATTFSPEELTGADFVAKDYAEVASIIKGLSKGRGDVEGKKLDEIIEN